MSTTIRPEISERKPYWISRHRYYELRHFCMQYREWEEEKYCIEATLGGSGYKYEEAPIFQVYKKYSKSEHLAIRLYNLEKRIELVKRLANQADAVLGDYIFKSVTEGMGFTTLKAKYDIPCERDMFYDRFRKFFWLLSQERESI